MYQLLTVCHSLFRWLVLISLCIAILRAWRGFAAGRNFTRTDNAVRHWTATVAHVQLVLGMALYVQSPVTAYFRTHFRTAAQEREPLFFGLIHITLMLLAIVLITAGSALAKRSATDRGRFRTMLVWFAAALVLILIAVPWPFSPLAARPYFR